MLPDLSPPRSPRTGAGIPAAAAGEGWKVLHQRPLTKLEQSIMERAHQRHKTNVAKPKVGPRPVCHISSSWTCTWWLDVMICGPLAGSK